MAYHYENLRLEKGMYGRSGCSFTQTLEELREKACSYAQEHLTAEYIANKLMDEHPEVFAFRSKNMKRGLCMPLLRFEQLFARLIILWQGYGWRLPMYIAKKLLSRVCKK